jgi:hypothetical protein
MNNEVTIPIGDRVITYDLVGRTALDNGVVRGLTAAEERVLDSEISARELASVTDTVVVTTVEETMAIIERLEARIAELEQPA